MLSGGCSDLIGPNQNHVTHWDEKGNITLYLISWPQQWAGLYFE